MSHRTWWLILQTSLRIRHCRVRDLASHTLVLSWLFGLQRLATDSCCATTLKLHLLFLDISHRLTLNLRRDFLEVLISELHGRHLEIILVILSL